MQYYVTANQINYGSRILPVKRVEFFSPNEWEEFIEEWLDLKKTKYVQIERLGGAGDKGRDVVAYINKTQDSYSWDCFQCKHYDQALTPTQVYKEFGKILYYTYKKDYPIPQNYYFISPKGCGTSLSKLLLCSDKLKEAVLENWDLYCKNKITDTEVVELKDDFLNYCLNFNYNIFKKIAVKDIVEEHKRHPNHLVRFGGGLPAREKLDETQIPSSPLPYENRYIKQLLLAYNSEQNTFQSVTDLKDSSYVGHFKRARLSFHCAEQLRNFSRDNLPVGTFEDFQQEIYDGVIDLVEEKKTNGFAKVKEVETQARNLCIASNPLKDVSIVNDKSGVCHQLVNESKITWIDEE